MPLEGAGGQRPPIFFPEGTMDQNKLKEVEARCTQESMPRCRAACPFRMDVRAFMEHLAEGRTREAGKLIERHLPLPEILARICDHPCEERCLRRDLGGSLAIHALEAACMAACGRQGKLLPRPKKPASIAVLGGGLTGLTVGYELSRKAYPVRIFHEEEPQSLVLRRFPQLPEDVVLRELEELRKAGCEFIQGALDAAALEAALAGHAAVFVDADAAPAFFAALGATPDPLTLRAGDRLCAGGLPERTPTGALYASSSKQAGEGRRAALSLERIVTGVSLNAGREEELTRDTPLFTPLDGVETRPAVPPRGESFNPEEAEREAARCLRCECLACVKECVYLKKYGAYPRSYTRQIYNNAAIVKGQHIANSLVNGCALCGQCTELCPERFSMAELCLSARQDMVRRKSMPPSAHEFALEDMESANSEACSLFLVDPDPKQTRCAYVFFPGCRLAAARGEQVAAAYAMLRALLPVRGEGTGTGVFLHCCGAPALWAGREEEAGAVIARIREAWEAAGRPVFVTACASCLKMFREAAPEIQCVSLWEILDERGAFPPARPAGAYAVHDPCSARHDEDQQRAMRSLARKCGLELEEPRRTGLQAPCCGYGGLVWNRQPELADAYARRKGELSSQPGLASCIMCRDRIVNSGGACLHMLDILPLEGEAPDAAALARAARLPAPGFSAHRAGRAALRRQLLQDYRGETFAEESACLIVAPELLMELERRHILLMDAEEAVCAVHAGANRFLERKSGHYVGSWRPRNVTFWVRYSVEPENAFRLHDAWCHRMTAPGTGGEA